MKKHDKVIITMNVEAFEEMRNFIEEHGELFRKYVELTPSHKTEHYELLPRQVRIGYQNAAISSYHRMKIAEQ